MNVDCFPHDDGYRLVATNNRGETAECVLPPDHPVSEYVAEKGRLNQSYVIYWLTEDGSQPAFLAFLERANDHFRPRRIRQPGWDSMVSDGTDTRGTKAARPGDVHVYGSTARGGAGAKGRN